MMAIDIVEKATAELMGYLAFQGAKHDLEVDDLLEELVTFLAHYQERKVR